MSLQRDIDHAADLLTRIAANLTTRGTDGLGVLDRIRDSLAGHPRAASYDQARPGPRPWCWVHERDLARCQRDGLLCSGEIIEVHDPTGEAAISGDPAAADLKNLARLAGHIRRDVEAVADILARYQRRAPRPSEIEATTNANAPHCESCARIEVARGVAWWVEPHTNGSGNPYRTTCGGVLPEGRWLCKWCIRHVTDRGCLPTEAELEDHRAGRRVRCPHPPVDQVA